MQALMSQHLLLSSSSIKYIVCNHIMQRRQTDQYPQQDQSSLPPIVNVFNLPEHANKEQIAYFIWKTLEKAHALKKASNPIINTEKIEEDKGIKMIFRSREEAINCLDLNGMYYGLKSLYMQSELKARPKPLFQIKGMKIRRVDRQVKDGFNKIYIGNLPVMLDYEILDWLCGFGELTAFEPMQSTKTYAQCYCEYANDQITQDFLQSSKTLKLKGRTVIVKRAALMTSAGQSKTTVSKVIKTKVNLFEKDLNSFYVTFDTVGFFSKMKISCILMLQRVISNPKDFEFVKTDICRQMQKIGPVVRVLHRQKEVFVEYDRVQYAQIAYLLLLRRKYETRAIEASFYDPVKFSEEFPSQM